MSGKREKRKTPQALLFVIVTAMLVVFVIQMIFPTNLGKLLEEECGEDAIAMNVMVTVGGNDEEHRSEAYTTRSKANMSDLINWASTKTARNRSIADALKVDTIKITKYTIVIEHFQGFNSSIVIDEKGFVHIGAELYQLSDEPENVIAELSALVKNWE